MTSPQKYTKRKGYSPIMISNYLNMQHPRLCSPSIEAITNSPAAARKYQKLNDSAITSRTILSVNRNYSTISLPLGPNKLSFSACYLLHNNRRRFFEILSKRWQLQASSKWSLTDQERTVARKNMRAESKMTPLLTNLTDLSTLPTWRPSNSSQKPTKLNLVDASHRWAKSKQIANGINTLINIILASEKLTQWSRKTPACSWCLLKK